MNRTIRILQSCALAAIVAAGASFASAAGLLNQRYATASYVHIWSEGSRYDDGSGYSFVYNHPVSDAADLGLSYSQTYINSDRPEVLDIDQTVVLLYGTGLGELDLDVPFVSLGLGWGRLEQRGVTSNELMVSLRGGAEWKPNARVALTTYAAWTDSFGGDIAGVFNYGVVGDFDLGANASVTLKLEGDHHFNVTAALGAVVRF